MRKTVAIVGRPNVGKSALFNRLAGKNISIVHDQPGVTRDRIMAECRRGTEVFDIMDTGGIGENTSDVLTDQVQLEASIALEVADVLLFVVDVVDGITPVDSTLAKLLRKVSKPVLLVCNKADSPKRRMGGAEFSKLGFADQIEVSAEHNLGIVELVERIGERFGFAKQPKRKSKKVIVQDEDDYRDPRLLTKSSYEERKAQKVDYLKARPLKLAIVGRPNAGKSSLVNALLNENRAIVSPLAGTTRDSLDIQCEIGGKGYQLIDTAGIRRQAKVDTLIEVFSVKRAVQSIERADLCLFVIDCSEGIMAQDRKIANMILDAHKPCVLVLNKWDLAKPDLTDLAGRVRRKSRQHPPIIACSAITGEGLDRIIPAALRLYEKSRTRLSTNDLNSALRELAEERPGPRKGKRRLSMRFLVQTGVGPPIFRLEVNDRSLMTRDYGFWLENRLRDRFDMAGVPVDIEVRSRR